MQESKLKHLLLKLFEITISYHSSGVNTLQCHFMYKSLKSFVSRCECVSCFDNILVVNPEERFTHDAAHPETHFWIQVYIIACINTGLLHASPTQTFLSK